MINAPHANHRLVALAAGVVAGEFAERPFRRDVSGHHFPLDHEFRVRGHRQAVDLALDYVDRFAAVAARIVELRKPEAQLIAAGEEQQRIMAA